MVSLGYAEIKYNVSPRPQDLRLRPVLWSVFYMQKKNEIVKQQSSTFYNLCGTHFTTTATTTTIIKEKLPTNRCIADTIEKSKQNAKQRFMQSRHT
jgi:hypothetical protein